MHDWSPATVASGAFHEVVVCEPSRVARLVSRHDHRERVRREHAAARIVCRLDLPYVCPRPIDEPITRQGRTGMLTTFVPGVARADLAWSDARDAFVGLLHAFRAIPGVRCDGLAPPRAWCGGPRWPDIVADDLVRHLPVFARARAERVVAELISTEQVGERAFVHGDVGLHNSLWTGGRLTGLIDADHACWGDPAMDVAPLIGAFGANAIAEVASEELLERAMYHRASLPLQVAAAAELAGHHALRDHALGNFSRRVTSQTLYDPAGSRTLA